MDAADALLRWRCSTPPGSDRHGRSGQMLLNTKPSTESQTSFGFGSSNMADDTGTGRHSCRSDMRRGVPRCDGCANTILGAMASRRKRAGRREAGEAAALFGEAAARVPQSKHTHQPHLVTHIHTHTSHRQAAL